MMSATLEGSFIRILSRQENALVSAEAKIRSGNNAGGVADIYLIRVDIRTGADRD
jgi:hypothetical protein